MINNLKKHFSWCDIFISVAAIVDFIQKNKLKQKIKKQNNNYILELQNNDILNTLSTKKQNLQINIYK